MLSEITTYRLEDAIAALPDSADAVAKKLISMNIKGWHEPWSCPIAQYLYKQVPETADGLAVLGSIVQERHNVHAYLRLKTSISIFVSRFDRGEYPELEG